VPAKGCNISKRHQFAADCTIEDIPGQAASLYETKMSFEDGSINSCGSKYANGVISAYGSFVRLQDTRCEITAINHASVFQLRTICTLSTTTSALKSSCTFDCAAMNKVQCATVMLRRIHLFTALMLDSIACSLANNTGSIVYDDGIGTASTLFTNLPTAELKLNVKLVSTLSGKNAVKVKPLADYPEKGPRVGSSQSDADLLALQKVCVCLCARVRV
jgi:hypothetical protein